MLNIVIDRSPRKVGNPPPSLLIVNKKSADQNSPSVFGFNAPVTTTYQTWSTSITTSTADSVTRHLELPEEPLLNGDKLVNSSSSNDSHFIPNGAIHYNTPINGSSKSASPEPMVNGTKCSLSPASLPSHCTLMSKYHLLVTGHHILGYHDNETTCSNW